MLRRPTPGARFDRPRRLLAAALSLSVALLPLLGVLHESSGAHARCFEHGELVDLPGDAAPLRAHAASSERASADEDPAVPSEQGHQHCELALLRHQRAAAPGHAGLSPPPATPLPERAPSAPELAPAAIALLHLAPKLSPPRA